MLSEDTLSMQLSQLKYGVLGRLSAARQKIQYRNFHPACGDDAVVHGIDDQIAYLARLLDRGNLEMFLKRLAEVVHKVWVGPVWGRALFIPELDELARRASLIIAPKPNPGKSSNLLAHIHTETLLTGGGTRVIEDIVASLPEYEHVLVVTGMDERRSEFVLFKQHATGMDLKIHPLRSSGWVEKAERLSSLIESFRPRVIMLMAHWEDVATNVAVAGHSAPRVLFLHHADHSPSLGAYRTDYTHVDLTPACHSICASHSRLRATMLNLTVKDSGTVQSADRRPMIGATCGGHYKYAGSTEFSYAQLLAALFSAGVGQIFHIGNLPDERKNQIRAEIAANGQDAQRVVFLPNTPSLAAKLIEISPDFFLASHPIVGGKATVEALSVGLPILHARPSSALPLLVVDMTFSTSVVASTLEQIPSAVRRLEAEKKALAKRSRDIYERHYSPAAFREGLLAAIGGG
jgi:hypothetical protein